VELEEGRSEGSQLTAENLEVSRNPNPAFRVADSILRSPVGTEQVSPRVLGHLVWGKKQGALITVRTPWKTKAQSAQKHGRIEICCKFLSFLCGTGVCTQGLHLEPLHHSLPAAFL
jgi:hypothetical protein